MIWGSAILDDRMRFVQVGDVVRITYEGQDRNKKGQALNLFRVQVEEPDNTSANDDESTGDRTTSSDNTSTSKRTAPDKEAVPVEEV